MVSHGVKEVVGVQTFSPLILLASFETYGCEGF